MNPNIRKIFISGHTSALERTGEIAAKAIKEKGVEPVIMPFAASGKPPANLSLEKLSDCDAVVLLIGNIYGNLQPVANRSIVEMEYDRAKELELDIFVFLVGKELPANGDKADRDRLEQFINKIRAENTYCQDNAPIANLAKNIAGAVEQASRYRAFVGPQVFYRSRLADSGSVFGIERTNFQDRKAELAFLSKFYAEGKKLLFLIGPAGSGKSHLAYEFAREGVPKGDWTGFWNGLDAGGAALQDIRFDAWKKGLITIECGDETDLRTAAGLVTNILNTKPAQQGSLKVIVTLRDYMRPECQAIWGRIFSDDANCDRMELQGLADAADGSIRDWIVEGARPVVISRDHARAIIESTRGLPLLIRLALDLIKSKSVSIAELSAGKRFRDVYLDALLKNVLNRAALPKFEAFLRLASLLSPYASDDEGLRNKAAQVLEIKPSDWVDYTDKAIELGVVKRTSRTCRVYPEIFGDYLVDRACYGQDGSPKLDWVQSVLGNFISAEFGGGVYARHTAAVVRNLAATEFRHQELGSRPSPLWTALENAFDAADNLAKQQWLKLFREIAYYKPAWAISLANKVAAESKGYPNQQVWSNHFVSGQDLVNDLAAVIFPAACHFDHLQEASDLLWEIGLQDKRKPGPTPEHALRQLDNLIEYKEAKPFGYTDRILDRIRDWLEKDKISLDEELSPVLLAGSALSKQIERTDWFRHSISVGTRFLTPEPALIALRDKARAIMVACLEMKYGLLCARHAIDVLSEDIKPPHGVGGAALSPELQNAWAPEQIKSLAVLESFVASAAPFPLKYFVLGKIKWVGKNHPIPELRTRSKELGDRIAADPEFQFAEVLLGKGWEDRAQERDAQAKKIISECPTPPELIQKLAGFSESLTKFYADKHRMGLGQLAHSIGRLDMRLGLDTAKRLLDAKSPDDLLWLANPLMAPARADDKLFPEYLALINKITSDNITGALSHLPSWYMPLARDLKPEEWPIIEHLATADCTKQNDMTFYLLKALSKRDDPLKQKVKDLLLRLPDVGPKEVRVADAMCQAFAKDGKNEGLTSRDFNEAEARRFTWKFVPIDELSPDSYWLAEWLAFLGEQFPDLLIEFFVDRMQYSKQLGEDRREYAAIPFEGGLQQYFSRTSPEAKAKLFKQLFELLTNELNSKDYDIRALIWHVLGLDFSTTATCFNEIREAGGEERIKKLIYLLQEAPQGFATREDGEKFVPDFLAAAKAISSDLFARAVSALISSATSGAMVGRGGEPPAELTELAAKCDARLSELKADDPLYSFYRGLRDHVTLDIKRFQEDDF